MSGAILDVFETLDRAGPGDAESLGRALALAGTPADAAVLDAGCGTGADLPGLLAAVPRGRVVAIDMAVPFVTRIRARFPQVRAEVADMADPPGGPFDLIWSAGAVYTIGIVAALRAWRGHLRPGGRVAFSDLCWTGADRPAEAVAFWEAEGLDLTDAAGLEAQVADAGWQVLGAFWLGQGAWAAYYEPLAARLDDLADATGEMADVVAGFRREVALWRRHGASFGYRMVVCAPAPGGAA
jgi:SAM-dependent methyltransferase